MVPLKDISPLFERLGTVMEVRREMKDREVIECSQKMDLTLGHGQIGGSAPPNHGRRLHSALISSMR
jgi:hypothetical protein